jgi:DNA-directed RNA polymerase specialized sigma24 family protein
LVVLLRDYIKSLSSSDANVFVQYFIIGKTYREIAEERDDGNIGNAKRRIQYKITKLKNELKKQLLTKEW